MWIKGGALEADTLFYGEVALESSCSVFLVVIH